VVGLVSLLGVGGGAYAIARNAELGQQTARCGSIRCIPVSPTMLLDALKQRGFTCEERTGTWTCQLKIAGTEFETYIDGHEKLITDLSGWVRSDQEDVIPAMTKSFLFWIGSLPVADDPVTIEEVRGWLNQRLEGGEQAKATIGSYAYELTAEKKSSLRLRIVVKQG